MVLDQNKVEYFIRYFHSQICPHFSEKTEICNEDKMPKATQLLDANKAIRTESFLV